jgi:RimJ/RimL family protein N-acetyltransferase
MLFGERIRFRGLERDDLPSYVRWINDPAVTAGLGIIRPYSQAEEDIWFDEMLKRPDEQHVLNIEVRQVDEASAAISWKLIGGCAFAEIDWRNGAAEIGIQIGEKSYWDQGYGTEAVRLLVKYGFTTLNLKRIYLRVLETNKRAIRAYEKAGFVHEVRMRQAEFRNGKYIDMLMMSILRGEF